MMDWKTKIKSIRNKMNDRRRISVSGLWKGAVTLATAGLVVAVRWVGRKGPSPRAGVFHLEDPATGWRSGQVVARHEGRHLYWWAANEVVPAQVRSLQVVRDRDPWVDEESVAALLALPNLVRAHDWDAVARSLALVEFEYGLDPAFDRTAISVVRDRKLWRGVQAPLQVLRLRSEILELGRVSQEVAPLVGALLGSLAA